MPKIYIINTNQTNHPNCELDMLQYGKCAAYYSPWKYYIDEIEANDIVFLYSNGKGIIARGMATGITEASDYQGETDEEHYMNLDRFQVLTKPLQPSEISRIVGHKIMFNQTVVTLPHLFGIKLWQHITKHCI
ncbi:hypothetical protein SDC9_45762 [bioreactor metagenome]|uniref:EVE domain-containing protein n=1 Tax=bioreactor metagenome TaxID=1076179 RepID=A0A644W6W0_9ZZZZ|nr:hypothetical protein [Desulfitobacterium hafniense]MEA5025892.1 hypothetical protein [Desulfitobacterium hafniense]